MGCATAHFLGGPAPWGPGKWPNCRILSNIIKIQLQSQFQRFLNQTLCFYSQMKDIKHIRRDFYSAARGYRGGWAGQKKIPRNSTRVGVWFTYMNYNGTCNSTFFVSLPPWGPGKGAKRLNIIKSQLLT